MDVSADKSKIMTNNTNDTSADITMNGQKLNSTSSAITRIRIASAMATMARLNRIWRSSTISFTSKFNGGKELGNCTHQWTTLYSLIDDKR